MDDPHDLDPWPEYDPDLPNEWDQVAPNLWVRREQHDSDWWRDPWFWAQLAFIGFVVAIMVVTLARAAWLLCQ